MSSSSPESSTASSFRHEVSQELPVPKHVTSKEVTKDKPTLILSPEDFAKDNLKVERDFVQLQVYQLGTKLKYHEETIDILSARCSLLQNELKEVPAKKAAQKLT